MGILMARESILILTLLPGCLINVQKLDNSASHLGPSSVVLLLNMCLGDGVSSPPHLLVYIKSSTHPYFVIRLLLKPTNRGIHNCDHCSHPNT